MTDTGIFGAPFSFLAAVEGNTEIIKFSGSFVLEELFTIEAEAVLAASGNEELFPVEAEAALAASGNEELFPVEGEAVLAAYGNRETSWLFRLVLKKLRVALTYDSKSQTVSGKIESDFLLEDCVSWFLSLHNPQETYAPSGDWKFLMGVNLKGLTLCYSHKKKEVSIGFQPSFSIPFGSFQEITLIAGAAGVRFEARGDFLGESYGEENPLSWEPNNPPETTGKLLQIHYFLLSNCLMVKDLDPGDLKKAVARLEEEITTDTDPSVLELSGETGILGALDCEIGDMVECRLLYNEKASLYGAYFRLYGEKAAGLAGLEAELSYGKVDDTVGMFHVRFVPPEKKEFQLGTVRLALGCVDAKVYTNGNFYIDIGFPKNHNFDASFAFQYGIFRGRGGMYLTQGAYGASSLLPKPEKGYFDHVIGAGLGIRLELGKSFRAGILSASALLVLQGILEGIYAVYEPNEKGKPSVPFYRLSAWMNLDGVLTGSVDFGIIGASVSLHINTQLSFVMQACERVCAAVELTIEASARVKILFVTIKFGFSLHYKAEFTFAEASDAPWKSHRIEMEQTENTEERDRLPICWKLPRYNILSGRNRTKEFADNNGSGAFFDSLDKSCSGTADQAAVQKIYVKIVPVFGGNDRGEMVSALFLLADLSNFALLMELLLQTMVENDYLNRIGTMELFDGRRIFADTGFLNHLLQENVVLEAGFPGIFYEREAWDGQGALLEELEGAFLPLPEYLISSLISIYEDGTENAAVSDLSRMQMIDDKYLEENDSYYASTTEHSRALGEGKEAGAQRSMQSWLWQDYWELLIKAIRAQKESAALTQREFRCENVTPSQAKELAGIANGFLLAGKRALSPGQQEKSRSVDSVWQLSGAGQLLERVEQVKAYRYELERTGDAPEWLTFAGGSSKLVFEIEKSQLEPRLPGNELPKQAWIGEVALSPAWTKEDAPPIRRIPMVRTGRFGYCSTGEGFAEGMVYRKEDGSPAGFCMLWKLALLRVSGEPALYRITEYRDFTKLKAYFSIEQRPEAGEISLICKEEYTGCYVVRGAGKEDGRAFAQSSDGEQFLRVLYQAFQEEAPLFLGFDRGTCPLPEGRDLEITLAVKLASEGIFYRCINGVYIEPSEEELVLWPGGKVWRQRIAQGSLEADWSLDFTGLTEKDVLLGESISAGAGELTEPKGAVLSHETPPFLKEEEGGKQRYRVRMPYARALAKSGQADSYAWIGEKREFHMSVFLLNLTGGRIETGKYVAFVPKYQDVLISPGAWPGITLCGLIEGGKCQIVFHGAGEQQKQLSEVICQLKQPDVTIRLTGTILPGEWDCKPEILEFLESCQKEPDKEHQRVAELPVRTYETPRFTKVSCVLSIERDSDLVLSDTPPEVSGIRFWIPLEKVCTNKERLRRDPFGTKPDKQESQKTKPGKQELHKAESVKKKENICSKYILFTGEETDYLLSDNAFVPSGEMQYFALRPFPDISGVCQTGEERLQLQSFSIQSAVELFEEDLAWLGLSAQMTALYEDDVSGQALEYFYQVRQKAAKALASQVCPVFEGAGEEMIKAVWEYAFQLASNGRGFDLRNLLFFGQDIHTSLDITEGEWTFKGNAMDKNYPVYLPVTEKGARLYGAVDARAGKVDFTKGSFQVSEVCLEASGEWFAAPEGSMEIPLCCQDSFRKPSVEKVPVPVILAREEQEQKTILTLELCPKGGDILHLDQEDTPETSAIPDIVFVFYRYTLESGKLRGQNTKESRKELLDWMNRFAGALQGFAPNPPGDLSGLSFAFQEKEGVFEKISCFVTESEKNICLQSIEVLRDGEFISLTKQGNDYFFPKGGNEAKGERLRLRFTLAGNRNLPDADGRYRMRMAMERPQNLESNVAKKLSKVFKLQSEVCFW